MTIIPKLQQKITKHAIIPDVRAVDRGRPDTVGQRHVDFAPPYQLGGGEPAIWLVTNEAGTFFLEGWTSDLKRIVRAQFPVGTMNTQFKGLAHGSDGWLYSVKESGIGTGTWTLVKRFRATSPTMLTFADYFTMPSTHELAYGQVAESQHFVERPLMSGGDGQVYAHIWRTGVQKPDNPTGFSLRSLNGGALGTEWEFPTVKTNYQHMSFGMGNFSMAPLVADIKRCMYPAPLRSRWVAVDEIPFYSFSSIFFTAEREWVAAGASGPHALDAGVGVTVQVWGDGYWDASSSGAPWAAVAAGLTSAGGTFTRFSGAPQERDEIGDPPSVHHSQRVSLAAAGLPTYEGHSQYGWTSDAIPIRVLSTSDQQVFQTLIADNQFMYLVLGGFACFGGFCPDSGSAQDKDGVWRAAIPPVGSLPTPWTRIIPGIGGALLISAAGFLWDVPNKYTKAGVLLGSIPTTGTIFHACGVFSALWK